MRICPKCSAEYPDTVRLCTRDGSVLEEPRPTDPNAGRILDGKYRLDAKLSAGGMGTVYRATHLMLGKPVAVKLINAELGTSPEIVRRFQREARAASNLNHPNIVPAYDLGQTDDGTLYIAMELVNGPSLRDVIRTTGPLDAERIVRLLRQVTSALSMAHRHGIIHRDLKPHNIVLAQDAGGRELAKLLDFGIAKSFDDTATQLTAEGFALGTPQYMSPEQAKGQPVDARSDLYALGVILYEMLVGEVPFNDPSAPAVLVKQLIEQPQHPSLRRPDIAVSPALEAIALRCLEKDPAARFQTADDFAAALEAASTGQVTAAAGPGAAADLATVVLPPASVARGAGATTSPASQAATVLRPETITRTASPGSQGRVMGTALGTPPYPPSAATAPPAPAPAFVPPAAMAPAEPGAAVIPPPPTRRGVSPLGVALGVLALLGLLGIGVYAALGLGRKEATAPPASTDAAVVPTPSPETSPTPTPAPSGPPASAREPAVVATPPAPERSPVVTPPAVVTTPAARGTTPTPTPAPTPTQTPAPAAVPPVAPARPENPPVLFQCSGAPEVCPAIRSAVDQALSADSLPSVRDPNRAEIVVTARVTLVEERPTQQFGTTFVVRTYTIELQGEERKSGDVVAMPAQSTVSFDARVGAERLNEHARLVAAAMVTKVREFWKRR